MMRTVPVWSPRFAILVPASAKDDSVRPDLGHRKAFYNLLDLGRSVSPRAKCLANNWFAGAWVEAGKRGRHDDEDQLDLDDIVLHSLGLDTNFSYHSDESGFITFAIVLALEALAKLLCCLFRTVGKCEAAPLLGKRCREPRSRLVI